MAWTFPTVFIFIGTALIFIESSSTKLAHDTKLGEKTDKEIKEKRQCSGFPIGLSYDSDLVIGWANRWENQCPDGKLTTSTWSPSASASLQDIKCCKGPVDQALSEMLFGLDRKDGGLSGINQSWNVQCSGNYVITGIKLVGDNEKNARVAGIKCSAVVDRQIDYGSCTRFAPSKNNAKTRDPMLVWQEECIEDQGLVAFYSENGFNSVKYGRCCSITGIPTLKTLPMSCDFQPSSMYGWSLSQNTSLLWTFQPLGDDKYSLWLQPGNPPGMATLTSPAYSTTHTKICLRLTYRLALYVAVEIFTKSYRIGDGAAVIKKIITLTQNISPFTDKDMLMDVSSSFQVIVVGRRLRLPWSTIMIKSIGFVESSKCQVDKCSQTSDCKTNEDCLPSGPNGFNTCLCKLGYERRNGVCQIKMPPTKTPVETTKHAMITTTGEGGKDRGGDGTISKPKVNTKAPGEAVEPWMYTVIGAICGTLLVVFLIFSFLTYRRRRLTRRTYHFNFDVTYPRARSGSGSVVSDNNNSYVMDPIAIQETEINSAAEFDQSTVPRIEIPDDQESAPMGTPPSHHYFEVEPEIDLERKTSQITLVSPLYGSCEDCSDQSGENEIFLEPPSDERELCAQLDREIDLKQLTILHEKQLGQGAFGYVHFGIWDHCDGDRKRVAVKSMKDSNSAGERIKFLQEAAIMKQFAHQNVVFMFGVVTKRYPPMIILEYMKNGNLRKYLRKQRKERGGSGILPCDKELQKRFLKMAREIAAGMTYLSGMQFVHRDLAARNILLDENMVCKIGDFGLARDLIGCNHYISQGGQIPVRWTAPEALSFRRYSSASDVWSFGVLLYEIWSVGKKPYEEWSNDDVIENVSNKGYRLPPPRDCPRVLYHLMIDCWHPEESKRPKFSQLKFCLIQRDEMLLGRQRETRQRSATFNEVSSETIKEDQYGELQYTYCKTD